MLLADVADKTLLGTVLCVVALVVCLECRISGVLAQPTATPAVRDRVTEDATCATKTSRTLDLLMTIAITVEAFEVALRSYVVEGSAVATLAELAITRPVTQLATVITFDATSSLIVIGIAGWT